MRSCVNCVAMTLWKVSIVCSLQRGRKGRPRCSALTARTTSHPGCRDSHPAHVVLLCASCVRPATRRVATRSAARASTSPHWVADRRSESLSPTALRAWTQAQPSGGAEYGVPQPRSLDEMPNNLPVQLTSFVGRDRELGELGEVLGSTRLLTLTGAGGCGKT